MTRSLLAAVALSLAAQLAGWADASSLVGPGAVGSYQGGGGGRRHGGFVRVSDPSVAFFVAGSTIRDMNGLYARVKTVPSSLAMEFQLAYLHDYTGWFLGLVTAGEEVKKATGSSTEWMLIDNDGNVRFRHDGDTLIPGSGTRWSHVHRAAAAAPSPPDQEGTGESQRPAGSAVMVAEEDDEDELPWQVIGVGAENLLERLRAHFRFYKHTVQQALEGNKLPPLPIVPWGGSAEQAPPQDLQVPFVAAPDELCADESAEASLKSAVEGARRAGDKWVAAVLSLQMATCFRHSRALKEAETWRESALNLFPRYKDALLEKGWTYLDQGQYAVAKDMFATVLHLDRSWPSVDMWLVRVSAHQERQKELAAEAASGLEAQETELCVAWRQTGGCDPAGAREGHSDRGCRATVASGLSGFCECRGAIGTTAESSCNHESFNCEGMCRLKYDSLDDTAKQQLLAEPLATKDKDPCSAQDPPPDWCSPNHYVVLGVRCDFPARQGEEGEPEELKRAYKKRSLQVHPDKKGGSTRAFQRVALAHEVLVDPERRKNFDEGDELKREKQDDGTEGPSLKDRVLKEYFPERYDCEPFGDPHSDRKEQATREKRRLERRRQDALARGERVEL